MGTFKDKLLRAVDNTANQTKNLIEAFNDTMNSIDWDSQLDYLKEKKKTLLSKGNDLFNDINELIKRVKDNLSDFEVTVPHNKEIGEVLDYNVTEDGRLVVKVSYENETTVRENKTTILLPPNCDTANISMVYDKRAKTTTISVPKLVHEAPQGNSQPANDVEEDHGHSTSTLEETIESNTESVAEAMERGFTRREAPQQ